jgi:predicted regulator of Ras-like GTPase activity (Roadblock/LC7/MglB family)
MSLKDSLSGLLTGLEGGLAVMVMADDGIVVEEAAADRTTFDLQVLGVEYAAVLREIRRTVEVIRAGALEEVCVTTDRLCAVMRAVNDELFALLVMFRDGNLGQGRHRLRLISFELARELA